MSKIKSRVNRGKLRTITNPNHTYDFFEEEIFENPDGGLEVRITNHSYKLDCGCIVRHKNEIGGICLKGKIVCRRHYEFCTGNDVLYPGLRHCCFRKRFFHGLKKLIICLFNRPKEGQ